MNTRVRHEQSGAYTHTNTHTHTHTHTDRGESRKICVRATLVVQQPHDFLLGQTEKARVIRTLDVPAQTPFMFCLGRHTKGLLPLQTLSSVIVACAHTSQFIQAHTHTHTHTHTYTHTHTHTHTRTYTHTHTHAHTHTHTCTLPFLGAGGKGELEGSGEGAWCCWPIGIPTKTKKRLCQHAKGHEACIICDVKNINVIRRTSTRVWRQAPLATVYSALKKQLV
jgi:hypothetical protein